MTEDILGFKVRMAMKVNPDLVAIADSIGIDESHGVVTLSGTVPSREMANTCELIAAGVADVAGVKNYLVCADEPQEPKIADSMEETGDPLRGTVPSAAVFPTTADSDGSVQGMLSTMSTLGETEATPEQAPGQQEAKPRDSVKETEDPLKATDPSAAVFPTTADSEGSVQGMLSTMSTLGESAATRDTLEPPKPPAEPGPTAPSHGVVLGQTSGQFTVPGITPLPGQDDPAEPATPREPREPGPEAPSVGPVLGDTSGTFTAPALPRVGGHLDFDKEVEEAKREAAAAASDDKALAPPGAVLSEMDYSGITLPPPDSNPVADDVDETMKKPVPSGAPAKAAVPENVDYDVNAEAEKPK